MEKNLLSLQQIQSRELDILRAFVLFCQSNSLRYTLLYGSLIGAVRHQGFIPWDDDIDVGMPRPDYRRLLALSDCFAQETGYRFAGLKGQALDIAPIVKVCDTSVGTFERGGLGEGSLWLDVFPIDGLPDNEDEARKHCKKIWRKRMLLVAQTSPVSSAKTLSRKLIKAAAKASGVFSNPRKLSAQITSLAERYMFDECATVSAITWANTGFAGRFHRSAFDPACQMRFEDLIVDVISEYDRSLRGAYGDYMRIPSENERETHALQAWIRDVPRDI